METPKISVSKQIYTIEIETYDDGSSTMSRTNEGFTLLELLGLCNFIALEIMKQQADEIEPDIINRKVILRY